MLSRELYSLDDVKTIVWQGRAPTHMRVLATLPPFPPVSWQVFNGGVHSISQMGLKTKIPRQPTVVTGSHYGGRRGDFLTIKTPSQKKTARRPTTCDSNRHVCGYAVWVCDPCNICVDPGVWGKESPTVKGRLKSPLCI